MLFRNMRIKQRLIALGVLTVLFPVLVIILAVFDQNKKVAKVGEEGASNLLIPIWTT